MNEIHTLSHEEIALKCVAENLEKGVKLLQAPLGYKIRILQWDPNGIKYVIEKDHETTQL